MTNDTLKLGINLLAKPQPSGAWDVVDIQASGLLRIIGWTTANIQDISAPTVNVNGQLAPLINRFKTYRPDVQAHIAGASAFSGLVLEYLLPWSENPVNSIVITTAANDIIFAGSGEIQSQRPAYESLLTTDQVLHRENIYGVGPPMLTTAPVVLELTKNLPAPILDFGCGSGVLVKELREMGLEAYGIEIDRPMIHQYLLEAAQPYVTIYDGSFPLPFPDRAFASVVSTEVIEHVPDYEAAVAELARVAQSQAIFTVPNINAIPICYQHGVVPWHLLEATHFNFFTQKSLAKLLGKYFAEVEFAQVYPVMVNGTEFYTSLVAICQK
ncbi:MAG TPA: class I SAM-dependent methyltransferase [Oscillatoriaceae cyanobacterium M33_DOE_052]|uniref:Class I SAM-dependent methyltransferase n=1 Tax=Planktothricoides sp. SpSt-374 TaxID=2282167 RepID=A0A7C3ZUJ5_9CYAN|nr:class I SAM-dependent methyltransferase [Oscillatoriaceae cyanobacterium M33_DOE_052]